MHTQHGYRLLRLLFLAQVCVGSLLTSGAGAQEAPFIAHEQGGYSSSNPQTNAKFGYSVALDGDTAVIGAPFFDSAGAEGGGAAHVFVRDGDAWEETLLLPLSGLQNDNLAGLAVAVDGDTIAVGIPHASTVAPGGAVHVFRWDGAAWVALQVLTASDAAAGKLFGSSLALEADTMVVGAHSDDGPQDSGAAYVFVESGGIWSEQAKLKAADAAQNDRLGEYVAISGDTAMAGTAHDDPGGIQQAGAVYAFVRSGTAWTQQQKLVAPIPAPLMNFSVCDISGDLAAIGAYSVDRVFIYERTAGVLGHGVHGFSVPERITPLLVFAKN